MLENYYDITATEELTPDILTVPKLALSVAEANEVSGRFIAEPLERGWATTLGNAIRRTLLNSIPGTAVTWVRIDSCLQEYTTIPHVREETAEILRNIEQVRLRALADRPGRLRLEVEGEGEVRAGDIMTSSDFEIVNPELHIATLDSNEARLSIELNVEQGSGYTPASHDGGLPIGVLPVDAIFSPIRKVSFSVENTRVGQRTDLERLVLEVSTDRTISPIDGVRAGSKLLMERFYLFTNLGIIDDTDDTIGIGLEPGPYNTPVEQLGLSARTLNCLKRAGINRLGEVLAMPKRDLLKIRNFGQKSLDELYEKLEQEGLLDTETPDSAGTSEEQNKLSTESDNNEAGNEA